MAYSVNSSTNTTEMLNDLTLKRGYIKYPFRILSGFDFRYNRKWDIAGDYVNDNTLTVYIKRIREKIERDPAKPVIIQTVRGLGYRMN